MITFLLILYLIILAAWLLTCIIEQEFKAAFRSAFIGLLPAAFLLLVHEFASPVVQILWIGISITALVILLFPIQRIQPPATLPAAARIDERNAFFHRFYRLKPGSSEFDDYYQAYPEQRTLDDKIRQLPHLGEPGTMTYNAETAPLFQSLYDTLDPLTKNQDIESVYPQVSIEPDRAACRIKGFAKQLGADLIGITRLKQEWIYSHVGRGEGEWGGAITLNHTHAIAIAVEMDHTMIRHAPDLPTMTESTRIYLDTARIAIAVAHYIRRLGYQARAHVDGNYRVLCIPIAVDAGLGELGRHGLLITPRFGSRVRLAIVTTDLSLHPDKPISFGVREFCRICKKCAENCPSGSIAAGDPRPVNGVEKWQSAQTSCYHYWRRQGTDCALCIRVCPYSHPDTLMHKPVRFAIRRNPLARKLAVKLDDSLYGRKCKPTGRHPKWHASSG